MTIDTISEQIIVIALYLDSKVPGSISEIWIGNELEQKLRSNVPQDSSIDNLINETRHQILSLSDSRRKKYLLGILSSLQFQIESYPEESFSYATFSKNAYGYEIQRVTDSEILNIEKEIQLLEQQVGLLRQQVFQKHFLEVSEYQLAFEKYVTESRQSLPNTILDFPDKGFEFEVVTNKPWSAFNTHTAPFTSKLTINSDVTFSKLDLHRLAFHEAYGGHHSELSNKDLLLMNKQRGEHGLVITFSPQTFISEAIAEGIYVLLGNLNKTDPEYMIGWFYDRLIFALQNAATFWFFDDHLSRDEIEKKLHNYAISDKTIQNILDFSTDKVFGKYAPVYYSAFNYLGKLYEQSPEKEKLIMNLFTQPCTPEILDDEI